MSSQRLTEGQSLSGRYEILQVVGRGGMGTVYRARDNRLDITVAVKEMIERDIPLDEREAAVRQFEREAKLLGQLTHPNLPRVTDFFVEADHCYLIMEFVEGRTLDSLLRENPGKPLPLLDVVNWGIALADVLAYLHGQEPPIVFRDLKPANIMLQDDGTLKLIDFGIARRFQAGLTKDTLLYGSPGYSPPEQYGRGQTDPRSDLYALGASLHHMATGRDPAPTPFKYPLIRSINPELPAQLEAFLARCVEMEEELRCQSAAEAKEALVQVRTAVIAEMNAPAPSRPARGTRPSTGPKVVSSRIARADEIRLVRQMGAALGIVLILIGVGVAAVRLRPKPTKPTVTKPAPPITLTQPAPALPAAPSHDSTANPDASTPAAQAASLTIRSLPPGAQVYVDDKELGPAPQDVPDVSPGRHKLRLVPAERAAYATVVRYVEVLAGRHMDLETPLTEVPSNAPVGSMMPTVEIRRVDSQDVMLSNPKRPGIRLGASFRVYGASGKKCSIAAFFYAADQATPLVVHGDADGYANAAGQLSVSDEFQPDSDPTDFVDFPLYIPAAVFPTPRPDQVTYRVVLYVDGKFVNQTDLLPLRRTQQP
jgi:serine/threonine protein kinase